MTGRLAVVDPPMQTIPRPEEGESEQDVARIRGMFVSRFGEAGRLVISDYSQLEFRLLVSEAEEGDAIDAVNRGEDLHNLTASKIFGSKFTKEQRSIAKTINFGIAYGIQAGSLAYKFTMPYDKAENILTQFWKSYQRLQVWMNKQHQFVKDHGYIVSRFGRVRHLPDIEGLIKTADSSRFAQSQLARMLRQAGNFVIQSQGADINNLASLKIDATITSKGLKSVLFLPIHDNQMIDTPKAEETKARAIARECMEDEMQRVCHWLKVELKVDQKSSYRWGC